MATIQEKMEALAYMVATGLTSLVAVLLGPVLFGTANNVNIGFNIQGDLGMSMLHSVQPTQLIYYGVIVTFFIAMVVRTVFVVFSKTTYQETSYL